jgi:hypothetical protein
MAPKNMLVLALVMGATLSWAPSADAQYKWRDKSGRVQYSDMPPPPGVEQKDILQQPNVGSRAPVRSAPAASAPPPLAPPRVDGELEARKKAAEAEQAARLKAEQDKAAAARASNCTKAQAQMRALQDGIRMARINEQGQREVLDDNLRAEEMRNTQAIIASDCQ